MTESPDTAPDPRYQAAVERHRSGRLEEAMTLYRQVLESAPGHPPTLHMLGCLALQLGQYPAAIDALAAAVAADGARADYRNDLGEAYRQAGDAESAAEAYTGALALDPGHAPATNNLGIIRHAQGRLDEACALYRRAIDIDPQNADAVTNLGVALQALGQIEEARTTLLAARKLAPAAAAIALNLGNLELGVGAVEAAEALYREALTLDPDSAPAQVNLGRALKEQGRVAEALSACVRARTMAPGLAAAHWNEGLCRLLLGDFKRGWPGFLWRWAAAAVPPHGLDLPEWDGTLLRGRHLLVHAEQGLGDTIQFIRFVPLLARFEPASVTVMVQPGLIDLVASLPGIDRVIGPQAAPAGVDLRVPLLDLPGWFGLGAADFAVGVPYLHADTTAAARWKAALDGAPGRRIGVVWKGRADHANDRNRSMRLDDLLPLAATPGTRWFSLQRETSADEEAALAAAGIEALGPRFTDMADTAAALAALDLVISVDTSIAHLAGALGRPVWVMLPAVPDWRWLLNRADSPWYPAARLFRQPQRGDWKSVVGALGAALSSLP